MEVPVEDVPVDDVPVEEVPVEEVPVEDVPVVEPLVEPPVELLLEPLELPPPPPDDFFFLSPGRLPVSRLATSSPPLDVSTFLTLPDLELDFVSLPPVALPTPKATPKAAIRATTPIAMCWGLRLIGAAGS